MGKKPSKHYHDILFQKNILNIIQIIIKSLLITY